LRLRLKAVSDLQLRTEGGKMFQILGRADKNGTETEVVVWL